MMTRTMNLASTSNVHCEARRVAERIGQSRASHKINNSSHMQMNAHEGRSQITSSARDLITSRAELDQVDVAPARSLSPDAAAQGTGHCRKTTRRYLVGHASGQARGRIAGESRGRQSEGAVPGN